MMDHFFKIIVVVLMLPIMCGCKEKLTYSYLIEHPAYLKTEFDRCQMMDDKKTNQSTQCDVVMKAADKLSIIVNEMQSDPEQFGEKIMASELDLVKVQDQLKTAQQSLETLKSQNASAAEIQSAQDKLTALQQECDDKHQAIKVMLAVVGLRSPE